MQKIIYTNNKGEEITIQYSPFFLNKISGMSSKDTSITFSNDFNRDGQSLVGMSLGLRPITIEFKCRCETIDDMYEKREYINRIFATKKSPGTLRYINNKFDVKCEVIVKRLEDITSKKFGEVSFKLDLVAHNPYLLGNEQVYTIENMTGGFKFPFKLPIKFAQAQASISIENNGHVETPIILEIVGPALQPIKITRNNKDVIEVKADLAVDEKLVINTERPTVVKQKITFATVKLNLSEYVDLKLKQSNAMYSQFEFNNFGQYSVDPKSPAHTIGFYKFYPYGLYTEKALTEECFSISPDGNTLYFSISNTNLNEPELSTPEENLREIFRVFEIQSAFVLTDQSTAIILETQAFNLVTLDSNIDKFKLDLGTTTLKVTSSNNGKPRTIIKFNERYEGL